VTVGRAETRRAQPNRAKGNAFLSVTIRRERKATHSKTFPGGYNALSYYRNREHCARKSPGPVYSEEEERGACSPHKKEKSFYHKESPSELVQQREGKDNHTHEKNISPRLNLFCGSWGGKGEHRKRTRYSNTFPRKPLPREEKIQRAKGTASQQKPISTLVKSEFPR